MLRFRSALTVTFSVVALLVAMSATPAQVVPQAPRVPGQGSPSTPTGQPVPAPFPSVLPTPTAAPSTSPAPAGTIPSGAPSSGATPGGAAPSGAPVVAPAGKPLIVRFSGQLLDVRNGYVYFTTADAFKASPAMQIVNLDPGVAAPLQPAPRLFARATLDTQAGAIVELALTKRKLAADAAYQQAYAAAHAYAITGSPVVVAPELLHGQRLTGRPVAVTFYVQVPPTTPLSDTVYITTDASGWVANAMKMDRIDALHYRLTRTYASGTKFAYRFTRGSWTSVEVGEDGLQDDPHQFFVPEVDAKRLTDLVYRWSDQNPTQPQVGPDSIPTPFNPNPFGNLPSGIAHPGIPQASPTPRP